MESIAAAWWEEGNFLQFVIPLLIGLLVGGLGAWATLRAANPKRVFNWWVLSDRPLVGRALDVAPFGGDGLSVMFSSVPLSEPRIVELAFANQGRRDITAAMFHNNDSIRFDLGVSIISVLEVERRPEGAPSFHHDYANVMVQGRTVTADTWLALLPGLLRRKESVVLTLLVDGRAAKVKCTAFPLVDVLKTSRPFSQLATPAMVPMIDLLSLLTRTRRP